MGNYGRWKKIDLCGWWPLECSRHLKGGEASRWVDVATWESQEPPKIRLGRREENKSHTTLSPIWYSFFTKKFNLLFKVPSTPIYNGEGRSLYKGKGVGKVTLLAPKRKRSRNSHFFQLLLKNAPIMPYNERYLLVFHFWHFPKATLILRTLIGRTSSVLVLDFLLLTASLNACWDDPLSIASLVIFMYFLFSKNSKDNKIMRLIININLFQTQH